MFTKTHRWIFAGFAILFTAVLAALLSAKPAMAAPRTDHSNNSCLSCHEDLYFLHDTGSWYCMTEPHKDRCTDCHQGNSTSFKMEDAHVGVLAHPQENNGEKCKQCHTEDVQARLDTFASQVGFQPVVQAAAYTPSQPLDTQFPQGAQSDITEKLAWAAGGIVLFGFWLALVLLSPQKP